MCSDHENDCTKSNSADTDRRRIWRFFFFFFFFPSLPFPSPYAPSSFFFHIEEIKKKKKGKKVSGMKGKEAEESQTASSARGAAIPGACGEQRLDRGAVWRRWIRHTRSHCSRGATPPDDRKVKMPPSDMIVKSNPASRKKQLTDPSISIASCSRLARRQRRSISDDAGHSSRHEGKLICNWFLMSSLTRLPPLNAVRHCRRRINSVLITVINQDVRLFMGHTAHEKKKKGEKKKRTPCSDDSQTQT